MLYNIPEGKYEVICVTNTPPLRKDFIYKTRLSEEQLNKLYEEVDSIKMKLNLKQLEKEILMNGWVIFLIKF